MNIPEFIPGCAGQIEFDYIEGKLNEKSLQNIEGFDLDSTDLSKGALGEGELTLSIVCHPHPVYGGTKDNKVVHTLCRASRELGLDCIRFNFRGVGKSEGHFDDGRGEYEDLYSVFEFVVKHYPQKKRVLLAGFSFGASIALKAAVRGVQKLSEGNFSIEALILIAPPVMYLDFSPVSALELPTLVVQGDKDEVVPIEQVSQWVSELVCDNENLQEVNNLKVSNSLVSYQVVKGATHFFHGRLGDLKDAVQNFVINRFAD